jgi:hypothetical protein
MYHYQPQTELFSIFKSSFSLKTRQQKVIWKFLQPISKVSVEYRISRYSWQSNYCSISMRMHT